MGNAKRLPPRRRKKSQRKPKKTLREPVPGELEQEAESWSGIAVGLSCVGVLAVFVLGWIVWDSLLAAGTIGAIASIGLTIGSYIWEFLKYGGSEE